MANSSPRKPKLVPDPAPLQLTEDDDLRLLDVPAAAELLGIHATTLRTLARDGQITYRQLGNRYRFTRADLAAYVNEQGRIRSR